MRGFALAALIIVGLDVVLTAPAARVSTLLDRPAHWFAAWMDPGTPLIPPGHLHDGTGTGTGTGTAAAQPAPGILTRVRHLFS